MKNENEKTSMSIEEYKRQKIEEYFNSRTEQENDIPYTLVKISENIWAHKTNMTYEEYLKKTGYKTYEQIKAELGLP